MTDTEARPMQARMMAELISFHFAVCPPKIANPEPRIKAANQIAFLFPPSVPGKNFWETMASGIPEISISCSDGAIRLDSFSAAP